MPASPKKSDPVKTSKSSSNVTPIACNGNGIHKTEAKLPASEPKAPAKAAPKVEAPSTTAHAELPVKVKKELDKWLSSRTAWNHNDWLNLLTSVESATGSGLTATQAGRDAIGLYLEKNRSKAQC